MRTVSKASRHKACQRSSASTMARMAPVSISPAAEAARKCIRFLHVLLIDDFPYKLARVFRTSRVVAANRSHGGHHPLANRSLLRLVIGMAVAALGEPVGGDAV